MVSLDSPSATGAYLLLEADELPLSKEERPPKRAISKEGYLRLLSAQRRAGDEQLKIEESERRDTSQGTAESKTV